MRIPKTDQNAVSPVIATLLMVTITVVLASTLYVAMSNVMPEFNGIPKVGLQTQTGGLSDTQMRVLVMSNEKNDASFNAYKISLIKNNTDVVINAVPVIIGTLDTSPDGTSISYSDDGNGKMSAGDTFFITGLKYGSKYELFILYAGDGAGLATWNT